MRLSRLALPCQILGGLGILLSSYLGWDLLRHEPKYAPTPERQQCSSNLDQIGFAFRLWASQHAGRFPFQLSTNQGGTREYRLNDPKGFDTNSYLHFVTLSNELANPAALVCPSDHPRVAASSRQRLGRNNVSYIINSSLSPDKNEGAEVLAQCPLHGYAVLADGNLLILERAKDLGRARQVAAYWRYDARFRQGAYQVLASLSAAVLLILCGYALRRP